MFRKVLATCVATSSIVMFSACESSQSSEKGPATAPTTSPASMGMLNSTCPMSGEAVDPKAPVMEYHGNKIGLCCAGCVKGWDKMSDADKAAFITKHSGK